jgi:hypothetical protein
MKLKFMPGERVIFCSLAVDCDGGTIREYRPDKNWYVIDSDDGKERVFSDRQIMPDTPWARPSRRRMFYESKAWSALGDERERTGERDQLPRLYDAGELGMVIIYEYPAEPRWFDKVYRLEEG